MTETLQRQGDYETSASLETVGALLDMTDGVLARAGFGPGDERITPAVEFRVQNPSFPGYDLLLYSIADGQPGFNTDGTDNPAMDDSRRWSVHIDTGISFGAAFNYKGTVYAHGKVEPPSFPLNQHNRQTGPLSALIGSFYEDPKSTVSFRPLDEEGKAIPESELGSGRMIIRPDLSAAPTRGLRRLIAARRTAR